MAVSPRGVQVGPKTMDPLGMGSFRWALRRSREHMAKVFLGSLAVGLVGAVIAAVTPPSEHASNASKAIHVGGWFLAGFGVIALLAFLYAFFRAPYEQRNALRRELRERAKAPQVEVRAAGHMRLSITNRGPTDDFKVLRGTPPTGHVVPWSHGMDANQRPTTVTQRKLLTGEHAYIQHYGNVRGEEVTWTILSGANEPLHVKCSLRVTQLKVQEMKLADEEWPERGEAWKAAVERLLEELKPLPQRFAEIAADDKSAAVKIFGAFQAACRTEPVVVGHNFMYGGAITSNEQGPLKPTDEQHVEHYRAWIERSIRDLEQSLARGTDVR